MPAGWRPPGPPRGWTGRRRRTRPAGPPPPGSAPSGPHRSHGRRSPGWRIPSMFILGPLTTRMCTKIPPDSGGGVLHRAAVVNLHVPESGVQGRPLPPHGGQIRPLGQGPALGGQQAEIPHQLIDAAVLMEGRVVSAVLMIPPPVREDDACALPSLLRGGPLRARKPDSPSRWKISGMEQPAVVSIIWSRSTASRPVRRESASPHRGLATAGHADQDEVGHLRRS